MASPGVISSGCSGHEAGVDPLHHPELLDHRRQEAYMIPALDTERFLRCTSPESR